MRKKRGMGCCYKRGNVWWIKFFKSGKPYVESSQSTKETDAIALLKNRLSEISQGTFRGLDYKKLTIDDLCQDFLNDYQVNQRKSLWRAELSVNHLKEFFGGLKACNVDTALIRRYIKQRQIDGARNATINRELAALRRMFRLAEQDDRIPRVPHFPMLEERNVRTGFLEHHQYQKLRDALRAYLKPILIMAYWTGCRKSEILSLKWSQVDFLNRQIRLEPMDTKNNEPRTIPVADELFEALTLLWQGRRKIHRDRNFVFTHAGKQIRYMRDAWITATEKADLKGLLFHDCRRTAVRNLVRAGVSDKVARTISGHKTRSVFDRYNIVDENDLKEATTKLQQYLTGRMVTKQLQFGHFDKDLSEVPENESSNGNAVTH
jgi:integrase